MMTVSQTTTPSIAMASRFNHLEYIRRAIYTSNPTLQSFLHSRLVPNICLVIFFSQNFSHMAEQAIVLFYINICIFFLNPSNPKSCVIFFTVWVLTHAKAPIWETTPAFRLLNNIFATKLHIRMFLLHLYFKFVLRILLKTQYRKM